MTFTLATENTRKCYQAPFPIFRTGPGNEASPLPLYRTAGDGKLGGGLGTRLAFRVIRADEALLVLATVDQFCVDVIDG